MNQQNDKDLHKNHRMRIRKRFITEGLDTFEPHNMLELLLFYSMPRKDTNNIAHNLIKQFNSLSGVFDAEYEELLRCDGIGENTAVLIKLIPELARAYMMDKNTRFPNFSDLDKAGEYLVNYYIGAVREKVLLILLNNSMCMIGCVPLSEGCVTAGNISVRMIAEIGFKHKASCFILAHNHPDGNPEPSDDDIRTTRQLETVFDKLGMPLIDHIIVAGGRYRPILRRTQLELDGKTVTEKNL